MYLIVGLGNHGDKYTYTRHNVGFLFVDELAQSLDARFSYDADCGGDLTEVRDAHEKYVLLKPHTYMNRSGEAVARTATRFHIPPSHIIVISDDTNLDLGVTRLRFGGEAGGHNGLKSIMNSYGSDFWRIRIGVGSPTGQTPLEAWVLGKLTDDDMITLPAVFRNILERYFENGVHLREETTRT